MIFRQALFASILLGGFALPLWAEEGLFQQLNQAKEIDPQYLAVRASREAALQGVDVARSAFGPKVTFSASAFRVDRIEQSRNFLGETVNNANSINSQNVQIQARQSIYRQRDWAARDQAMIQLEGAEALVDFAGQDLTARLIDSWIAVIAARDLVSLYQATLRAAGEIRSESESRFKAGEETVQDLELARARFEQAFAQLEDSKARLEIAEIGLRDLAGPKARVPDRFTLRGLTRLDQAQYTEQQLVAEIEQKNLEVISARFQEDAARLEVEKARSDRLPTVDAFAAVTKGQNDQIFNIRDENRIGLQLSVPIYTHGSLGATIAQADANYRKAQAQTRGALLRARTDGLSAHASLAPLMAKVMASDRAFAAGLSLQRATQLGVKAGVNTRADLARATQELVATQRQQIENRREYVSVWLKLQRSLSALTEPQMQTLLSGLASGSAR